MTLFFAPSIYAQRMYYLFNIITCIIYHYYICILYDVFYGESHSHLIYIHTATLFTRLEESIQGFSYISEEQKFKAILSDGYNVKQCASFLKTILKIRRSELMKPQGH